MTPGDPDLRVLGELEARLRDRLYPAGRPRSLTRPLRWLAPAGGLLGLGAVLVAITGIPGSGGVTASAAASALDRAARAAAAGPKPPSAVGSGEFWYTRTTSVTRLPVPILTGPPAFPFLPPAGRPGSPPGPQPIPSPPAIGPPGKPASPSGPYPIPSPPVIGPSMVTVVWRTATETWVGRDGTTRTRMVVAGPAVPASPADAARLKAAGTTLPGFPGSSDATTQGDGTFPTLQGLFRYTELLALPRDPPALYRRIRDALAVAQARAARELAQTLAQQQPAGAGVGAMVGAYAVGGSEAVGSLEAIKGLLESPVPAAVRVALYRAAALVPGVRFDGTVRDSLGRRGVGISTGPANSAYELILDPATGVLLGQHSALLGDTATTAYGVTRSIGERPAGVAPLPGPPGLGPVGLVVSPPVGGAGTTFTVRLRQPVAHGFYAFSVTGPEPPGCQPTLLPMIPGQVTRGSTAGRLLTEPLAPPPVGSGRAWCRGSYQVGVFAAGRGSLGSVRFEVR